MAKFKAEDFTGNIVGIVIAVIVVCLIALPIINGMIGTDGTPEGSTYPIQSGTTLATVVQVIPIFLILAVLLAVVALFMKNRN